LEKCTMTDHGDDHGHGEPEEVFVRVKALEALLSEKGLIDPTAMDELIDQYENRIGPHIGAKVVAKAWVDGQFKARLLSDPNGALAEVGVPRLQGEDMVVVENTSEVHNVIVCTLCSCYPWGVLGLPPAWYKSTAYRAQVVLDPRAALKQCGLSVPTTKEVRVWDSTAELRYMVLPMRPEGTEALTENELAQIVTRDSMIGIGEVAAPAAGR
jgi:nitrile hydratase